MKRVINFFKEIKAEMSKVTWLTRNQAIKLTLAVLLITTIIGIFLQVMDVGFQYIITNYF